MMEEEHRNAPKQARSLGNDEPKPTINAKESSGCPSDKTSKTAKQLDPRANESNDACREFAK
jgi:hypothetical protein